MKYAFAPKSGFVSAQVFQVSDSGYICRVAFLQVDGSVGSFSGVESDQKWSGATFETLEECLKAIAPEIEVSPSFELLNYNHPNKKVEASIRANAQKSFELLQANLPAILNAIRQGQMYQITDWGGGWEWTATLLDIKVEGRSVEYFGGGFGGVAFYEHGQNGRRMPRLIFKESVGKSAVSVA